MTLQVSMAECKCPLCGKQFEKGDVIFFMDRHAFCNTDHAKQYFVRRIVQIEAFEQHELENN